MGYHIPKGAIILPNLWSMAHDESKYPNHHEFNPERWLHNDGSLKPNTTENIGFGFGRRICPGRHFAETSLWLAIAKSLAVFKILKATDENGVDIPIEPKLSSGLVVYGPSPRLPPGPPGLPFIGNVIGINMSAPWVTYSEWAKMYGDPFYIHLLGKDIIVINSETVANELLENRSSNYSDRPQLITSDLCGVAFSTIPMTYGDRWRLHRRFFNQTFRREAVRRFIPLQHRKTCQFLRRLLETPDHLSEHLFEYVTPWSNLSSWSGAKYCVYDYDATSRQDELVDIMGKALQTILDILSPENAVIIDALPALILELPSWFPGMSFKNKMATARECAKIYVEKPFAYSMEQLPSGSDSPSMVYDALRNTKAKGDLSNGRWIEELKSASATGLLAASETSNSLLMIFFLMMVMYPEAQKKAQDQIDSVVGKHKLPTIEDRPGLPYVDAILRETFRYCPVIPLGIPHAVLNDDIYNGFHIPKGAMVMPNLWAMAHDESKYPNPHEFIPDRFLNDDGTLKPNTTEHLAFGFGRRICVGRYFADTSVWSIIANVLAVYDVLRPLDENGVEIPVEPKFSTGITIHPLPFGFRIVPRTPGMDAKTLEELIDASTV